MTLDQSLQWFVDHNVVLIEGLFVVILVGISFILFRSVVAGKEDGGSGPSLAEIEKALRQVLNATDSKPRAEVEKAAAMIQDSEIPSGPVATAGAANVGPTTVKAAPQVDANALAQMNAQAADLEKLRKEMQDRERALADLQKALEEAKKAQAAAPVGSPPVDTKPLEDKIKELQAKLTEYEIIEDDIANLSTYKQENQKLKGELDSLKAKLGGTSPAETGTSSDNVKRFAALVGTAVPPVTPPPRPDQPSGSTAAPAAAPAPSAKVTPPAPAAAPNTNVAPSTPAAAPATTVVPVAAAAAATTTVAPSKPVADVKNTVAASAPTSNESKVTSQASDQTTDSTPLVTQVPDSQSAPSDSVFGDVDTEKLLAETANLPDSPAASGGTDEDNGAKLISEFENFMKGG